MISLVYGILQSMAAKTKKALVYITNVLSRHCQQAQSLIQGESHLEFVNTYEKWT